MPESDRKGRKRAARAFARSSRLRLGRLESRGLPAILLGVSAIVLAAGASSALRKAATLIPETLRESRQFWVALREQRRELTG